MDNENESDKFSDKYKEQKKKSKSKVVSGSSASWTNLDTISNFA